MSNKFSTRRSIVTIIIGLFVALLCWATVFGLRLPIKDSK